MKVVIGTEQLKQTVNTLLKVNTKDIGETAPGGLLLQVKENKLRLSLKKSDFRVEYVFEVEGAEDGAVLVPVQVLASVVDSMVDRSVTIQTEGTTVVVKTTSSVSVINTIKDVEESATEELDQSGDVVNVGREVLIHGLRMVQHAVGTNIVKPELMSVFVYTKDGTIYFVATDTFRLAEVRFPVEGVENDISLLVPAKNILKIVRVLEGSVAPAATVQLVEGGVNVFVGEGVVFSQVLSGAFPDYKKALPSVFSFELVLLKSDLINFFKKAQLFTNNLNKLTIDTEDVEGVRLGFSNKTVGSTNTVIPAVRKGSIDQMPSFNYRFVSDAVSVIRDDRVSLGLGTEGVRPLLIRGVHDSSYTALISPLVEKTE